MRTWFEMRSLVAFAAAALLLTAAEAAAQNIQYGLKGGLSFSHVAFSDDDDVTVTPEGRAGLVVGGFVTRQLREGWSAVAELLLSMKGSKLDAGGSDAKVRLTYVEIPLLASAELTGPSASRLHLYAGPALAFKVGENVDPDLDDDDDAAGDNVFKPFDFSLAFGGNVRIRDVFLDLRYTIGLVNVADEDDFDTGISAKNRTFSITIGFRLY
jgi:hypothetical protein